MTDPAAGPRTPDPDADLVRRCRRELPYNTTGFAELVRRHEPAVQQLCAQYLSNDHDAEEVTQNAFLKVFRSLQRFEGRSTFKTWLYRIAVNECSTRYRLNSREYQRQETLALEAAAHETATMTPDPQTGTPVPQFGGPVGAALETLSDTDREMLVLRHIGEQPLQDIADALDLGLSATKMRLYRAEDRFRAAYATALRSPVT